MKTTLIINAKIMFSILNSALKARSVVKLPGPAINGKANGKTDAVNLVFSSSLTTLTPLLSKKLSIVSCHFLILSNWGF